LSTGTSLVIGITGPPGAGKSTLVNALIQQIISSNKTTGVLCVDPSSPFNFGALMGDRIRMNQWYNHPNVFIRSLAARGSLGGLHPNIIEITELMKSFGFDYIIIETVGVGQSEVEIAGLADITIVTLSPEAGDEIQTMKAGIMEIADIFVVNKADRPEANNFVNSLKSMVAHSTRQDVPVLKTIASENEGIAELLQNILEVKNEKHNDRKHLLYAEKAFRLIQKNRMSNINRQQLIEELKKAFASQQFNLFDFVNNYNQ
jgi:LAO/AO transport system kinase